VKGRKGEDACRASELGGSDHEVDLGEKREGRQCGGRLAAWERERGRYGDDVLLLGGDLAGGGLIRKVGGI